MPGVRGRAEATGAGGVGRVRGASGPRVIGARGGVPSGRSRRRGPLSRVGQIGRRHRRPTRLRGGGDRRGKGPSGEGRIAGGLGQARRSRQRDVTTGRNGKAGKLRQGGQSRQHRHGRQGGRLRQGRHHRQGGRLRQGWHHRQGGRTRQRRRLGEIGKRRPLDPRSSRHVLGGPTPRRTHTRLSRRRSVRVLRDEGTLLHGDLPHRFVRRSRPLPAQQPEHEQPGHQQRHLERTPPVRPAQHARGGTGQDW